MDDTDDDRSDSTCSLDSGTAFMGLEGALILSRERSKGVLSVRVAIFNTVTLPLQNKQAPDVTEMLYEAENLCTCHTQTNSHTNLTVT